MAGARALACVRLCTWRLHGYCRAAEGWSHGGSVWGGGGSYKGEVAQWEATRGVDPAWNMCSYPPENIV